MYWFGFKNQWNISQYGGFQEKDSSNSTLLVFAAGSSRSDILSCCTLCRVRLNPFTQNIQIWVSLFLQNLLSGKGATLDEQVGHCLQACKPEGPSSSIIQSLESFGGRVAAPTAPQPPPPHRHSCSWILIDRLPWRRWCATRPHKSQQQISKSTEED